MNLESRNKTLIPFNVNGVLTEIQLKIENGFWMCPVVYQCEKCNLTDTIKEYIDNHKLICDAKIEEIKIPDINQDIKN